MDETSSSTCSDSNESETSSSTKGLQEGVVQTDLENGQAPCLGGSPRGETKDHSDGGTLGGVGFGCERGKTLGAARPTMLAWDNITYRL